VLSAATGFALGISFTWRAILISSVTFAIISAAVLHSAGFGALPGISIIVACLTVNQMAYLIGVASLSSWGGKSHERRDNLDKFHDQSDKEPSENSQNDIARKHNRNENAPT